MIPFGALVDYYPTPNRPDRKIDSDQDSALADNDEDHGRPKMGPKGVPGIFLGYTFEPGGYGKLARASMLLLTSLK